MRLNKHDGPRLGTNGIRGLSLPPALSLAGAALMLAWPAFYNGFPLLYPDSMTYLDDGRIVARAVFLHQLSSYYGMRSFFYSLAILPFHLNLTPWPVVALQCLLVAWVLRLTLRAVAPRLGEAYYLLLVLLLSLFSSVAWFSSLILPDILGPVLYLGVFLLTLAPETLRPVERRVLYVVACWAVASHATHLLLSGVLCLLLAAIAALQRRPWRHVAAIAGRVAAIAAVAAAAQLALHGYLYGRPTLNGERPPFLMARVIADGPGLWYLRQHCGQLNWSICAHVNQLTSDPDQFLWGDDGVWATASDSAQRQLLREEMPLVTAALRAYPRQQAARSFGNFLSQLWLFGLYDLDPSSWVLDQFDTVMPASRQAYLRSRQARNALPLEFFTTVQYWSMLAVAPVSGIFLALLWPSRPRRLLELGAITVCLIVANAAVTGPLSMPEDRFACRLIWMAPLFAGLSVMACVSQRRSAGEAAAADQEP